MKITTSNAAKRYRKLIVVALSLSFAILAGCGGGGAESGTPGSAITAVSPVARLSPDNGSAEVSTSGIISVSFNADMDASTINSTTFQVTGPDGAISGTLSYDGARTATFAPTAPLMPQASYTATLTSGVKDKNGIALSSNNTWNFKTGMDVLARPAHDVIPPTLFGLHIFKAASTTPWPTIKFGTWRLWNANVNWPNLEPKKGEWHFEVLDKYMSLAEQNQVEIVLPLAYSPTWASARPTDAPEWSPGASAEPADIANWRNYVRTVATRYKGRIAYYELWNEPNLNEFFSGSVDDMITLTKEAYAIIQEIDPSAKVISPSATSVVYASGNTGIIWLNSFLEKGGANYTDIVGFHFYDPAGSPESQLNLFQSVKTTMAKYNVSKPLWNTESGWRIQNHLTTVVSSYIGEPVLTDNQATGFVARGYVLHWASGINRFYWFGLDSIAMALMESDGKTMKAPAIAYNVTYSWLNGAMMLSCGQSNNGVWVTRITRANGNKASIVWSTNGSTSFELPKEWEAKTISDLTGNKTALSTSSINISSMPVMVENM